jgi:selenocysteine-specific elongation factor
MRAGGPVKHLIIGTAGHVDHGKTALVKALTGIDCDTHREEKRRGITINLGFAHLALPSGDSVGIVDVPGHRDFVHTMVSGASGIDLVLFVIAADEGVMPQTREHLAICEVLGVKNGIVVLNKADLADAAAMGRLEDSVKNFTKGTFLEGAPVAAVSSLTGQGMEELKRLIAAAVGRAQERPVGSVFWMYIDRIFSVSGFGTVVTGSVKSGVLRTGDTAYLLPPQKSLRVRRLERHGVEVSQVTAGDRASLNLVGLSKEEFVRGMLVSDRKLGGTTMLDVRLRLFAGAAPLDLWSQAMLIIGTFEAQARVHLLDADTLRPGESGLAQLHLPHPCIAQAQDAFVIRNSSNDMTIGGGEIVDPHPLHHRRRSSKIVLELKEVSKRKLPQLVANEIEKHPKGIEAASIAETLNASPQEILSVLETETPPDVVMYRSQKKTYCFGRHHRDVLAAAAESAIRAYHDGHRFDEAGRTLSELTGMLGMGTGDDAALRTRLLLDGLVNDGVLKQVGRTYSLASHAVVVSKEEQENLRAILEFLGSAGMQVPLYLELVAHTKRHGIDERRLTQLLQFAVTRKMAYRVDGEYLHASVVDRCRRALLEALARTPGGLTVAGFRDLVSGNRKICLLLYALFDSEGITERQGDVRVITEKGRSRNR